MKFNLTFYKTLLHSFYKTYPAMQADFNHNMLILARESRGLSQLQLADMIGMSPANFNKIERAGIGISTATVEKIAEATAYPPQFFYHGTEGLPTGNWYRKRQVVAQKLLMPVHAQANIIGLQVQQLCRLLQLPAWQAPPVPQHILAQPLQLAQWLRTHWQLKQPVINNLASLLESKGIVTAAFNFNTPRIDSTSVITATGQPVIITSSTLPGCRQRFSLAYELGHLLLHPLLSHNPLFNIHHAANLFAAAFLMPQQEMMPAFNAGVTIPLLAQLKKQWKVSMIALLYRADDLGSITANQKRYLLQQFNSLGIRRREPPELDVPFEKPALMRQWIATCKTKLALGTSEMAALLCIHLPEYLEQFA